MLRERNDFINVMAKAITSDGEFGFGNIKCLNQHLYYCCIFLVSPTSVVLMENISFINDLSLILLQSYINFLYFQTIL